MTARRPGARPRYSDPIDGLLKRLVANGDCLEFMGARIPGGYGSLSVNGRVMKAHRFAYELAFGPIPAGLLVCHQCDNPPCCNPAHLFLGTHADNARDSVGKGRHWAQTKPEVAARGEEAPQAKLTETQARHIIESDESATSLARRYGVSLSQIFRIRNREQWKHLQDTRAAA